MIIGSIICMNLIETRMSKHSQGSSVEWKNSYQNENEGEDDEGGVVPVLVDPPPEGSEVLVGQEELPEGGEGPARVDLPALLEHVAVADVVVAGRAGLGEHVRDVVRRRVPIERRAANSPATFQYFPTPTSRITADWLLRQCGLSIAWAGPSLRWSYSVNYFAHRENGIFFVHSRADLGWTENCSKRVYKQFPESLWLATTYRLWSGLKPVSFRAFEYSILPFKREYFIENVFTARPRQKSRIGLYRSQRIMNFSRNS